MHSLLHPIVKRQPTAQARKINVDLINICNVLIIWRTQIPTARLLRTIAVAVISHIWGLFVAYEKLF